MPHTFDRKLRVADHLKQELASLLLEHSHDPRFKFVSLSCVEISRDYSIAKVFVYISEDAKIKEITVALNKAAGFFRSQLARRINLRTTPRLHFVYDDTLRQGERIARLLSGKPVENKNE